MPTSYSSPQISKVIARRAIERLPEVRNGKADLESSVAGYCNDGDRSSYGKVWALLSTSEGPVQYTGYADDQLRRTKAPSGDFLSTSSEMVAQKMSEGFQDIDSGTLRMRPWSVDMDSPYRGSKCALKKRKACKQSKKCSYRKGVFTKSGKKLRAASCAKKSRRRRRTRRLSKSESSKKMRRVTRPRSSKSRSKPSRKRHRNSLKKMRRVSKANTLDRDACIRTPGASWVKSKKNSHVGYCRKVKRSRRTRSGKKMRRVSRRRTRRSSKSKSTCNMLESGKKRGRKACKRSKKCSWRKSGGGRKGYCARK